MLAFEQRGPPLGPCVAACSRTFAGAGAHVCNGVLIRLHVISSMSAGTCWRRTGFTATSSVQALLTRASLIGTECRCNVLWRCCDVALLAAVHALATRLINAGIRACRASCSGRGVNMCHTYGLCSMALATCSCTKLGMYGLAACQGQQCVQVSAQLLLVLVIWRCMAFRSPFSSDCSSTAGVSRDVMHCSVLAMSCALRTRCSSSCW